MSSTKQNIFSMVIILLVIALIAWAGEKPPLAPAGVISLDAGVQIDANQKYNVKEVNLYQAPPIGTQELGTITAELAFDPNKSEQQQIDTLVEYVRYLAGDAGANGVVVVMFAPRGQVLYFNGRLVKN